MVDTVGCTQLSSENHESTAAVPSDMFKGQEAAAQVHGAGVIELLCRDLTQRRPV